VALAQLLVDPGNVLLMDEPTNHLDLDSSERLAEALQTFDGTLLFVSHNRSFIRKLATKIWFVADGKVETYPGTLDEYLESARAKVEEPPVAVRSEPTEPSPKGGRQDEKAKKRREAAERSQRNKRLRPLEKRSAELEARITELEVTVAGKGEELSDPAVFEDGGRRDRVMGELTRAQAELEVANDTWMEVQEELERLRAEE